MKIVAIGNHIRPISCSSKALGYETYSISYFNDLDLRICSKETYTYLKDVIETESLRSNKNKVEKFFKEKFEKILNKENIKMIIPKRNKEFIEKSGIRVVANSYKVQKIAENKVNLYRACENLGINVPAYIHTNKRSRLISFIEEVKNVVLKPIEGSHGTGIFLFKESNLNNIDADYFFKINLSEYVAQEYIAGESFNINLVRSIRRPLYISKQIIGEKSFGARDFVYCGNIGYIKIDNEKKVFEAFYSLGEYFDVRGIFGGDFIIKNGLFYVVDFNPRIQGSYDCIEKSYCINPLLLHIKDFFGEKLEKNSIKHKFFSGRAIIYAKETCKVKAIHNLKFVKDVPKEGTIVMKNEPICTVVVKSDNVNDVFLKMKHVAEDIYKRKVVKVNLKR